MKKFLLLILVPILISCDYDVWHDFYIINTCNQNITVNVTNRLNSSSTFTIPPQKMALIYHEEDLGYIGDVTTCINSINVYKDSVRIDIDPMDPNLWHCKPTSRFQPKGATSTFSVKPEHFPNSPLP